MRRQRREAGLIPPATPTPSNRKSPFKSPEQESAARQDAVSELMGILRQMLPVLLRRLGKIPEPRNPKKLKHQLTVLMLYGLLVFVFQYGSRRAANGEITRPMFEHNLRLLFPQLESLPHSDTLFRLLCRIDVSQIAQAHIELVKHLLRGQKFTRYLINNGSPIAI
ncbi:MAG: transposase family protein, partial [Sulfitobacter sp.]|nr:transposase family protein [Sulfitobacter sp.]